MSASEYWDQVELIELGNPKELLLPSLRNGFTRVNQAYLAAALKRLPDPDEISNISDEISDIMEMDPDDTLRELWRKRTLLFGEMNKLSNLFHECTTDQQRASNSLKVMAIWSKIQDVKAEIEYYKANGEALISADDADQLPDNPVALSKKLNSLRARISQKKQQLVTIAGLDEGTDGKQSKIDAAEEDLKRLKHLAGLAEQKLKTHEQG